MIFIFGKIVFIFGKIVTRKLISLFRKVVERTQDMLYSKFIKLGLESILHWWGFEDIMEKYYFAGEYYERG